jgi:hypothetical protein
MTYPSAFGGLIMVADLVGRRFGGKEAAWRGLLRSVLVAGAIVIGLV